MIPHFILASQSPRRKQLLEMANLPFVVQIVPTDETYPTTLSVQEVPLYIAQKKAAACQAIQKHNQVIIACDTVVVLENTIMGKPQNRAEAIAMLQKLSGTKHQVITAVVIMSAEKIVQFSETTTVHFYPLTQQQIAYYVDTYQPYDKAGGYGIQEWIGVVGVKALEGDYYNVVGMPVSRLLQELQSFH